jgi:hypothetical protein
VTPIPRTDIRNSPDHVTTVNIGVIGHRYLSDPESIEKQVDLALLRIQETFKGDKLNILSQLAIGADQIVARRALTYPETRLLVPLPMPLDIYLEDFGASAARDAFFELYRRAYEIWTLPGAGTRDDAYYAAGVFLVERSDVVVAVWDGQAARGRGGTAEMVALSRERGIPLAWILARNNASSTENSRQFPDGIAPITFERFPT